MALLRIAEFAGGSDWQDRRLDVTAEATALFDALPSAHQTPEAIAESLRRSGTWMEQPGFTDSWFLDDPATRAVLRDARKRKARNASQRLLREVMPALRAVWAERFLFLALRGQASRDTAGQERTEDLAVLVYVLNGDTPLEDIPLMRAIAEHSEVVGKLRQG